MPACFACQHLARVLPLLHRKYSKDSQPWCVCECRAARSLDAKNPLSRVTSPRGGIKRLVFPFGALIGAIPGGRARAFLRLLGPDSNPLTPAGWHPSRYPGTNTHTCESPPIPARPGTVTPFWGAPLSDPSKARSYVEKYRASPKSEKQRPCDSPFSSAIGVACPER